LKDRKDDENKDMDLIPVLAMEAIMDIIQGVVIILLRRYLTIVVQIMNPIPILGKP